MNSTLSAGGYWPACLAFIPLLTVFGNVLVIIVVVKNKNLHTVINYFIFGLAVADLMLAVAVMPFAVYVEVNNGFWQLGTLLCDLYCAADVACSTTSIFLLTIISFDRYTAAAQPIHYAKRRKGVLFVTLVNFLAWFVSFCIASPMVLGLNNMPDRNSDECRFYNAEFIIFSSFGSFVVPLCLMSFLHWRIYRIIKQRSRLAVQRQNRLLPGGGCGGISAGRKSPKQRPVVTNATGTDRNSPPAVAIVENRRTSTTAYRPTLNKNNTTTTTLTTVIDSWCRTNSCSIAACPTNNSIINHVYCRTSPPPPLTLSSPLSPKKSSRKQSSANNLTLMGTIEEGDDSSKNEVGVENGMKKRWSSVTNCVIANRNCDNLSRTGPIEAIRDQNHHNKFPSSPFNTPPSRRSSNRPPSSSSVVFFLSKQRSLNFRRRPQGLNSSCRRYHTRSVGAEKLFRIGAQAHDDHDADSSTTRKVEEAEQDTCLLNKRMSKVSGESVSMESVKSRIRTKMQRFSIFSQHSANNKSLGQTKSVEFTERSCPPALSISSSSLSSASISDTDLDIYLDETLNRSTPTSLKKKITLPSIFQAHSAASFRLRKISQKISQPSLCSIKSCEGLPNRFGAPTRGGEKTTPTTKTPAAACVSSTTATAMSTLAPIMDGKLAPISQSEILEDASHDEDCRPKSVIITGTNAAKALEDRRMLGRRLKKSATREKKATKTLAIVLGIFLTCWLPFFSLNLLNAICIKFRFSSCQVGLMPFSLSTWLGYVNSCMNPIIYTIFNMEFRRAFRQLLCPSLSNK